MNRIISLLALGILLTASCSVRDLRTSEVITDLSKESASKGRQLLEESYVAMGYDRLTSYETFKVKSQFDWKKPWTYMPMNALPGNNGKALEFRFATNTFDGQVDYLEGKFSGETFGLQSWQTYKLDASNAPIKTDDEKRKWGLATYHYVIEAPMRVRDGGIVRYAGEKNFEGTLYDLVFVTWGKDEPHKEHDQYLVYINRETKMTDLMEITINDFFLPMPGSMKNGTIRTKRSESGDKIFLPSEVFIQLGEPKPIDKHVYKFTLTDYEFDTFSVESLYPLKLEKVGDSKEI